MRVILRLTTHSGARVPDQTVEFEALPPVGCELQVTHFPPASVDHPGCNALLIVCGVHFEYRAEWKAFVPVVEADAFGDAASWPDQVRELAQQYEALSPLAALLDLPGSRASNPHPRNPRS